MHLPEHPNIYFPLPVVHCAGNKSYRCHVSRFHLYYMIPCIIVTDSCKISVLMSPASLNVKVGSGWAFCYCCCQYYLRWEECAIECRTVFDIQIPNVIHDIILLLTSGDLVSQGSDCSQIGGLFSLLAPFLVSLGCVAS